MLKKVLLFLLLSLLFITSRAQDARTRWVDSVFSTLDRTAKIGQLFMVPVSSYDDESGIERLIAAVKNNGIGGIYITAGGPLSHARLLNRLQKASKVPLLAGVSAEWGLAQTLDSTMGFQKPMVTSAWKEDSLTVSWAKEIAQQMKLLGFHINFAPNGDHEIFAGDYLRYFGDDDLKVGQRTVAFTKAMQAEGILCVAKHLPRKLPTEPSVKDSTLILNLTQIDTAGLSAFRQLIENGVKGIHTSYLHFPIQNEKEIVPAAISQIFISDILKKKLNFTGLVFTDVKTFQKTAGKVRAGEAELLAFETGNDVLMAPVNINSAIKKIAKRIKKNKLLEQQLTTSVKKILGAKFDAGLQHSRKIDTDNLFKKLHPPISYLVKHQLAEASVTVLKNENNSLPIRALEHHSFVSLSIGKGAENDFTHSLKKYAAFKTLSIMEPKDTVDLYIKPSTTVIVGIFPYATALEKQLASWIQRLLTMHTVIVVHFGNPLTLDAYKDSGSLIAAYTDQDYMSNVVPQTIFGALPSSGVFPVGLDYFKRDHSIETTSTDRFSYTVPEAADLDSRTLEKIKVIMKEAIDIGATPGCHVLVAKDGKVVYEQSAGWLTYENKFPVTDETIYDLASLTKVSATLQSVMVMYEKGLIDINKKASVYLPELKNTNKKDITIIDMLTHQSGLIPYMLLWPQTMKDSAYLQQYYSSVRNADYPLQVAPDLFASSAIRDSVWGWISKSKMQDKPTRTPYDYRYSDLGFIIFQRMTEQILNLPLDDFLHQNFYEPLGAYTTGFNPLDRFPKDRIAPTEEDKLYRRSTVVGTVHDERAAMMGGVAGHAGLFSTANDLAKLGQMLLQEGHYGGHTYFKPGTIRLFTAKQFEKSRRGLGWDKPLQSDWTSPVSFMASPRTFGHTGFTGTCMWIDPEFNLVYIFLSNRVYPDRNNKLLSANIRSRIQEVIYQAMFNYCANKN